MRCSPRLMPLALLGLFTLVPALAAAQSPAPTEATPPADAEKAAEPAEAPAEVEGGAKGTEPKGTKAANGTLPARNKIIARRRRSN